MPQAKATILEYLVEPINDREKDSAMFVLEKIRSIMRSCKTIRQLSNAWSWGRSMFNARFPEHYNDFYYTLHGDYDLMFDKIIEQMEARNDAISKVKITRDIHLESQTQSSMGDIEI